MISKQAFTLLELWVVLLILGLCASIVFPRIRPSQSETSRLMTSARRLVRAAKGARDLAVCTHAQTVLILDGHSNRYWVEGDREGSDAQLQRELGWKGALDQGITLGSIDVERVVPIHERGPVELYFSPEGCCQTARVILTTSHGQQVRLDFQEGWGAFWDGQVHEP